MDLAALPPELIVHIARRCSAIALFGLPFICKASRSAVAPVKNELWKTLTLK